MVRGLRLGTLLAQRLLREGAGYVVVEGDERIVAAGLTAVPPGLLLDGLPVTGVVPPISRCLSGDRDHAGDEDERLRLESIGHQRCGERAVRLANDDKVAAIADGVDHGVGIVA